MKKIFTLAAAVMAALTINAKEDIDISSIATDGVVTFNGGWQWKGITYSTNDESGATTYADKSAFKYVVFEYSTGTCADVNVIAQYLPDGTTGQWGANYYNTTASNSVNGKGGILAVQLDPEHSDSLNAIALQNQNTSGTITITSAYFATQEEYDAAKAEADKIEKTADLDVTGGEHALKAGDWGWDSKWLDKDVTDFNTIVFEIASVTGHGKITVQGQPENLPDIDLPESSTPTVYYGDISSMTRISQYAYQNINTPDDGQEHSAADISATTINVTKVYLSSKTVAELQAAAGIGSVTAKDVIYDANAPLYNLAGQKVGKDYKGIVIQNGKKRIQ